MPRRMAYRRLLLCLLLVAAAPPSARETVGVFGGWGAFRQGPNCYAIARPVVAQGRVGGYAGIGTWPGKGLRASLHLHLSRRRALDRPVTLSVAGRRFPLVGTATDLWAPDAPTDRAAVAALRSARAMSVEAVDTRHRPFADTYALAGAATAIDAATLACVAR